MLRVFRSGWFECCPLVPCCWGGENGGMVKKFRKHAPEQIVRKLEKARELKEGGATTGQVLAEPSISEATFNRWRAAYGQTTRCEAREPARLRKENNDLKRLLGQAGLGKAAWKELAEGNFQARHAVMKPSGIWLAWRAIRKTLPAALSACPVRPTGAVARSVPGRTGMRPCVRGCTSFPYPIAAGATGERGRRHVEMVLLWGVRFYGACGVRKACG